ncbi:Uncharacterised protein [Serratia ficaria]|uniref:hypothetical protein n=1 Tax=Serratia ficaria TaxID=61651 RepID=UPI002182DB65|nr:hypothetical protein [Serratia ficaria]CAI2516090.1 Uncharacterised protein [Serratia ficaria]
MTQTLTAERQQFEEYFNDFYGCHPTDHHDPIHVEGIWHAWQDGNTRAANREAQPVAYLNKFSGVCMTLEQQPNAADDVAVYAPLYTAPPAPAVTGEMLEAMGEVIRISDRDHDAWNRAKEALAACSAEMLTASPAAPPAPDDLTMQVRRLVHALKKSNPDHALVKQVPDYMRRAGYWKLTDCLRGAAAAPEVKP